MKTADVSDVTTRGWDVHTCCWLKVRSYYCFNFYFKYVWLPMNICPCLYCTTMCVSTCVCPCVNSGSIDSGQEHLKKKNKSTQTSALPSVQGAILKQKESFGRRKEMDRKKKQILKCALKKSRLKASFFSPFFLASFFAAIERSRMIVGCSCKWRG